MTAIFGLTKVSKPICLKRRRKRPPTEAASFQKATFPQPSPWIGRQQILVLGVPLFLIHQCLALIRRLRRLRSVFLIVGCFISHCRFLRYRAAYSSLSFGVTVPAM